MIAQSASSSFTRETVRYKGRENASNKDDSLLDRSLSEHWSISWYFLKGVASNGENIWRLPKPGYHIGSACLEIFPSKWTETVLTLDSMRFSTLRTHGCCCEIKDFSTFIVDSLRACAFWTLEVNFPNATIFLLLQPVLMEGISLNKILLSTLLRVMFAW